MTAIAAEAGSIAIVPGGGPFADAVRTAQASMGYDDRAAHAMALMAMAQFGCALQSLNPALTAGRVAFRDLARAQRRQGSGLVARTDGARGRAAGNLGPDLRQPRRVAGGRARRGPSACWSSMAVSNAAVDAHDLAARGVVDPLFPRYLKESGVRAWLAAPTDSARLAEGLRRPIFPEIVVAT